MTPLLFVFALVFSGSSAFQFGSSLSSPALQLRGNSFCSQQVCAQNRILANNRLAVVRKGNNLTPIQMSFFGLGWAEVAVIGTVALLVLGPQNLNGLAKDLGKIAGTLRTEAYVFSETMNESLREAEKAMAAGEKDNSMAKVKPSETAEPAVKRADISEE